MRNDDWFDDSCSECGELDFKKSTVPGLCKRCADESNKDAGEE